MTSTVLTTLSTPGTYPLWYKAWRWLQSTELCWPGLSFLTARLSMATEIKVQCWLLGTAVPVSSSLSGQGRGKRQTGDAGKRTGRGRGGGAHLESQLWQAEAQESLGVQGQPHLPRD